MRAAKASGSRRLSEPPWAAIASGPVPGCVNQDRIAPVTQLDLSNKHHGTPGFSMHALNNSIAGSLTCIIGRVMKSCFATGLMSPVRLMLCHVASKTADLIPKTLRMSLQAV